jgi:hypothetical protein
MIRSLVVPVLACAVLVGTTSSCSVLGLDERDRLTLYVAPTLVDCTGVGPQQCLLVKRQPDEKWSYFYDSIIGFTHEPGYRYTLLVERKYIPHPPADGSSMEYRLLRILAREAAHVAHLRPNNGLQGTDPRA